MNPANALLYERLHPIKTEKGVVYQINCEDCGQSYIGETGRSLSTKCREHMGGVDCWKPNCSALSTHAISNDQKID